MRSRAFLICLALALALAVPAAAHAATTSVYTFESGSRAADFFAGPGEANQLTVTVHGDHVTFHDAGAPVQAGEGCRAIDLHTAVCDADIQTAADLGDRADSATFVYRDNASDLAALAAGGDGDDRIDARDSPHSAFLYGDAGDDVIAGGVDDDALEGGDGGDTLTGAHGDDHLSGEGYPGAAASRDSFHGGAGRDTVSYGGRKQPVTVDLRHAGPQGELGEGDTMTGIENVTGGRAADRLVGDEHANVLRGGGENDSMSGLAGDDVLWATNPHRPPASGSRLGCGAGSDLVRNTLTHTVVPAACEHARANGFSIRTAFRRVGDSELRVPITQRPRVRAKPYCRGTVELSGPYPAGSTARPPRMGIGSVRAPLGRRSVVHLQLNAYGRGLLAAEGPVRVLVSVGGDHRCDRPAPRPPRAFTLVL
ncbi:MAG: hypothetical protein QOJ14_2024 [Thermoleophilaceae bacterium]|nr:hypothetical protein [Thermoleophilaceae bacterium]